MADQARGRTQLIVRLQALGNGEVSASWKETGP
jgi:hypothetical protein